MGNHSLLQGIFPTQGWNPGLLHCRQIPYRLSNQGSPIRREVHIPFFFLLLLYPNVLSNRHSFVYLFSKQLLRAPLYLTNCSFLGAYESVITDDWFYFKFMSTKVTWVLLRVSSVPWLGDNHLLPMPLHMSSHCVCPSLCPHWHPPPLFKDNQSYWINDLMTSLTWSYAKILFPHKVTFTRTGA